MAAGFGAHTHLVAQTSFLSRLPPFLAAGVPSLSSTFTSLLRRCYVLCHSSSGATMPQRLTKPILVLPPSSQLASGLADLNFYPGRDFLAAHAAAAVRAGAQLSPQVRSGLRCGNGIHRIADEQTRSSPAIPRGKEAC